MSDRFQHIEEKYAAGIELLKQKDYYDSLRSEIEYLVKYLDTSPFIRYLSENLFSDIQGVFATFVREDLSKIYEDFLKYQDISLDNYYESDSINLEILKKCAANLNYQVKSIIRLPQIQELPWQTRHLKAVSRKFYGEVQLNYRELETSYKHYFRKKFSRHTENNGIVSLACLKKEIDDYDRHFMFIIDKFERLSLATRYVREYFIILVEDKIKEEIGPLFNNQDRFNKLISYFLNDLKRTFIHILYRQAKRGKKFLWIQEVSLEFLKSERFGKLLKKVIYQTFSLIKQNSPRARAAS